MNLIRCNNPELESPLGTFTDQINRLFGLTTRPAESFGDWSPALDAFEDKEKYTVSIEVPGLKKDDLNVTVHDGVLTVEVPKAEEAKPKTIEVKVS